MLALAYYYATTYLLLLGTKLPEAFVPSLEGDPPKEPRDVRSKGFVRKDVPRPLGWYGFTDKRPRPSLFVRRHAPSPLMRYVFPDKRHPRRLCLSQIPYRMLATGLWYGYMDRASVVNRFGLSPYPYHSSPPAMWYALADKRPSTHPRLSENTYHQLEQESPAGSSQVVLTHNIKCISNRSLFVQ